MDWPHIGPTVIASFSASLVEFVEALTVVLAVGVVRGWRSALLGAGTALLVLLIIVAMAGRALIEVPLASLQVLVGALLLLFGMRWLRKAILRAAGIIALHDEAASFVRQEKSLRLIDRPRASVDPVGLAAAFKITMLEGAEVVFIVIALGAGGANLLLPASAGALAALLAVVVLGTAVHKPLARIPENALKFCVGVMLSAFGSFWVGEGFGWSWPGGDWAILALIAAFLAAALLAVALCRRTAR